MRGALPNLDAALLLLGYVAMNKKMYIKKYQNKNMINPLHGKKTEFKKNQQKYTQKGILLFFFKGQVYYKFAFSYL